MVLLQLQKVYFFIIINKKVIGLLFNSINTLCRVVCIMGEVGEKQSLSSQLKRAFH